MSNYFKELFTALLYRRGRRRRRGWTESGTAWTRDRTSIKTPSGENSFFFLLAYFRDAVSVADPKRFDSDPGVPLFILIQIRLVKIWVSRKFQINTLIFSIFTTLQFVQCDA